MISAKSIILIISIGSLVSLPVSAQTKEIRFIKKTGGLRVELKLPDGKPIIAGKLLNDLKVVIKNTAKNRAIVIRGIRYDYRTDNQDWYKRIYGSSFEQKDGLVAVNEMNQSLTTHVFEMGLLLPGEAIEVLIPYTPQYFGSLDLFISHGVIGGKWRDQVLIPRSQSSGMETIHGYPRPDLVKMRRGRGGMGLVRSTMTPDGNGLAIIQAHVRFELPVEKAAADQTGGINLIDASRKAGIDLANESYWSFYNDALKAWLFIRDDRTCRSLANHDGTWQFDFLCSMDVEIPDHLGAASDQATAMLLNPEIFGDICNVMTPWTQMYYNPGITMVPAAALWPVLTRAREQKIGLEYAAIDPNGLGTENVITAGVKIDAASRWLDPKIEPKDVPLSPR